RIPKRIGKGPATSAGPLTDADHAVLGKVDGEADERELALALGMAEDAVHEAVTKLALLGLVDFVPSPAAEEIDLEPAQRQRVLDLHAQLATIDHYALLGVARDADKKAVKRAYFELAGAFHPDRFFRKRLGSFKPKMEAIFGRVTIAHDVLTDKEQRVE